MRNSSFQLRAWQSSARLTLDLAALLLTNQCTASKIMIVLHLISTRLHRIISSCLNRQFVRQIFTITTYHSINCKKKILKQ